MTTTPETTKPALETTYLGLQLANPVVVSANPLTRTVESMKELERAGAAAIVLPSLFQEEVEAEEMEAMNLLEVGDGFAEFDSAPLAEVDASGLGTDRHIRLVQEAKAALGIPVIASVNGVATTGWTRYAKFLADAGADAVELNLYGVNSNPDETAGDIEARYLEIIETVKSAIDVPLAVKLSQNYQSLSNFARRAKDAGADGLVLFNRFLGPDIDLTDFQVVPKVHLSNPAELRLRMRWIAILRAQMPELALAATGGVHSAEDVLKSLLVGANVACVASHVLQHGAGAVSDLVRGLETLMSVHEYASVEQLCGSMSSASVENPGEFERAQYVQAIRTWTPKH